MELRVPHVTSYARAPSSLLFLRSARYPQMPRFLQFLREFWPMPLPLMIHPALALFAQRTRIPTPRLLCLRNARAFPLQPAALASVSFGFVLVRVRVRTWGVIHERALSPADLFGGKTPAGA